MLYNYLKIAFRQLRKHKLFSALNIFSLATSMSVCLLLIMILADQYGYDTFHEKGDRIYRIISAKAEGHTPIEPTLATTSLEFGETLKEKYPFIDKTVRIVNLGGDFKIDGEKSEFYGTGYAVDNSFLEVFSFGWQEGDQKTALQEPHSIVLTKELAEQFFEDENPLGRIIELSNLGEFKITGLMPDPPIRSHIYFDYLVSYSTITAMTKKEREGVQIYGYDNIWRGLVYVLLNDNSDKDKFDAGLNEMAADFSERDINHEYLFEAQHLSDVLPSRDLGNDIGIGTPSIVLYFLMALGFIIMLAACFNYMNLSVARSLKRAKEIGIRKVIGARRRDVVFQFLGEAIIISLLSFLVAAVLLEFLIPVFYGLDPFVEEAFYLKKTPALYLIFFVFSLSVGLIAGIFPALNISKFQPLQAIQQFANVKLFSRVGIRKALVTIQFALSLVFILTVIIVLQQQKHVMEADLGVNTKNLFNVWMNDVDYDVFAQKVRQLKGVEDVCASRYSILLGGGTQEPIKYNDGKDSLELIYNKVSSNYIEHMGIELIAGKNFPEDYNSDQEQFIILNKKATERLGFETPNDALGTVVTIDTALLTIIGVTADFYHDNIWFEELKPYSLRQGKDLAHNANIRLTGIDRKETIAAIHEIWNELSPDVSISSYFTDTRVYFMSKFFRMGSGIISFVGFLTILISCMGLLGMVVYTIEGKLKEVGIRKVLGASIGNINWQLAKGFFLLLGIAILIAVPFTVFVSNMWLQNFTMHISVQPWMVLAGVGIILMLAMLTVLSQTNMAARTNPVNVLKDE